MRKITLVVLGSCLLAGAVVAGPPPTAAPAKPPAVAAAAAPAPAAAAAAATAAAAPGPGAPKKGFGAWMKTLKERFLRRCENPWAPDPS